MVINFTQEKKSGAPSCPQEKGTGALRSQEKETGTLLFSGERHWCSTVFRRLELVHYCFQDKETGTLLFSGVGNWCYTVPEERKWSTTVLKERKLVHYCSQEKKAGASLL